MNGNHPRSTAKIGGHPIHYPELIARWPRVRNHPRRRELGARIARVRTWLETAMHAPGTSAPRTTAQAVGGSQTTPRADAAAGVSHGHA